MLWDKPLVLFGMFVWPCYIVVGAPRQFCPLELLGFRLVLTFGHGP